MTRRGVVVVGFCSAMAFAGTPPGVSAQTAAAGQGGVTCGVDLVKSLAGTWKAPQYKMKRASEVGTQVFGPNSFDIRNLDLSLDAAGQGVLKISTSVLDQKGKSWAPTVIEAKLTVAAPQPAAPSGAGRCEPVVTVVSAEERYLDDTNYHSSLAGSRVRIVADQTAKQLELRYETPKGEGSFWSTLTRQVP